MDPIQLLILGAAFALGAYAGYEIKLKNQFELAQAMLVAVILYVAASFMLNIFQMASAIFMGITMVLMIKTVILGTVCMLVFNSLK